MHEKGSEAVAALFARSTLQLNLPTTRQMAYRCFQLEQRHMFLEGWHQKVVWNLEKLDVLWPVIFYGPMCKWLRHSRLPTGFIKLSSMVAFDSRLSAH